jgi:hypothetical protein
VAKPGRKRVGKKPASQAKHISNSQFLALDMPL